MNRTFLIWGFSFGFVAVILGALGAHALENQLTVDQLDSFKTGVRYQMYHAILLLVLSHQKRFTNKSILSLIVSGTLLFSFSIYLLSCRAILPVGDVSFLGPITPIGGTLLIIAWAVLIVKAFKLPKENLKDVRD
ncbi:MAG: DUF423 domain-containing protein [Vicingaceae bacterium]